MKKNIGIIGIKGLPSKGGGERVAEAIIEAYLNEGHKVTVYAKKRYRPARELPVHEGLHIVLINDIPGKHISAFSFGVFSMIHALSVGRYDAIHLHYADFGFLIPFLRLRYKVLCTSHGAEYNRDKWNHFAKKFFRWTESQFVRYSTICTSVSKSLADYYEKNYCRTVHYIPNGIHLEDFQVKCAAKRMGGALKDLNEGEYVLFAAGRIIPTKGCALLLEACNKIKLSTEVVVVGDLSADMEHEQQLKSLAGSNIRFWGFVEDKNELFRLVSGCRSFVFPSTYEAMSMMLLEVAAAGKCVICSDIVQNKDALGDSAIYFKSGSADDLAETLYEVVNNPGKVAEYGVKARQWVEQHRVWRDITPEYIRLIDELTLEST